MIDAPEKRKKRKVSLPVQADVIPEYSIREMKKILIINGPNLNLLGKREPEIYGSQTFEAYFQSLQAIFPDIELHYFQSNHEGALIDKIHEVGFSFDGIVLNAGAYTHTSVAIADALSGVKTPAIEVHISNVHAREAFRHHSYLSSRCKGVIVGLGLKGYELAIKAFL
jgi:3-dehydroquinate dehydratase II